MGSLGPNGSVRQRGPRKQEEVHEKSPEAGLGRTALRCGRGELGSDGGEKGGWEGEREKGRGGASGRGGGEGRGEGQEGRGQGWEGLGSRERAVPGRGERLGARKGGARERGSAWKRGDRSLAAGGGRGRGELRRWNQGRGREGEAAWLELAAPAAKRNTNKAPRCI